jgi:hypothetical protein
MWTILRSQNEATEIELCGASLGVAFAHFLIWLGREARSIGCKRVYFLSNEGQWFAQQYEYLRARTQGGSAFPPSDHLAVSRRSTYLASFCQITAATFKPLLAQYREASVRAVLESCGYFSIAALEATASVLMQCSVNLDDHWLASDVADRVLGVRAIRSGLEALRKEQQNLLLRYLAGRGIQDHAGTILLADIGWRGTIQDNLARLLPGSYVNGLYFHLQPYFVPQASNVGKRSFLLGDGKRQLLRRLRFASPMEFALRRDLVTTIRYRDQNGVVDPIYDDLGFQIGEKALRELTQFSQAMTNRMEEFTLADRPDQTLARSRVLRYLEDPPIALAHLFFCIPRDERFGNGSIRKGAPQIGILQVLDAMVRKKSRLKLARSLAESQWPWALLKRDLPYLYLAPILRHAISLADASAHGTEQ